MGKTLTIRLTKEQEAWLERVAKATGRPRGQIVREQIEKARGARESRPFMRLAGSVKGPRDLSRRKGFSRS
jgi:predicted transcriptional regulator